MKRSIIRLISLIAISAAAALGVAACSQSGSGGTKPPVIVTLADADGTTVTVPLDNVVDLKTDDKDSVTDWKAKIADTSIVEFQAGKKDDSAEFNPGLKPLKTGETKVTMTNSATDKTVTFTVKVTDS